jgi:nitrite reductase/ring-hydroxylating ferredoxin subunit
LIEKIGMEGVLGEVERRSDMRLVRCEADLAPPIGYDDLVGWFPQSESSDPTAQATWALGLCPALGRMSWTQLEGAGLAAERWGNGRLRTTPEQGLMILDVKDSNRDAIATQLARWNLSVHVDSRSRSVMACTGKQFCNIAVTETKAHALQLIEQLRQRSLELHGIHIHMSGCPSSCANHHTADIGLKGVRVRRLLGTREGFDVLLGGGVAGSLKLGMPYQMGVDVNQLPNLVEEVVREYYLRSAPSESFSDYWRNELQRRQPAAAKEEEYHPPIWECDKCGHRHLGDDPPVYCPNCAALRRNFARLEHLDHPIPVSNGEVTEKLPHAVDFADVPAGRGLLVNVEGREVALFRAGDQIHALDNTCPHAGGSLAEGTIEEGCVTCPLHGWQFDVRTGHGVSPTTVAVAAHSTRVEDGKVFVSLGGRES